MQERRAFLKPKRSMTLTIFIFSITFSTARAEIKIGDNRENPEAVKKVLSGKQSEANAAWWGFNKENATDALQSAINSGAEKLVVPNMRTDWIVTPIKLTSNQEILFEEGVVVTAKKGEFRGSNDCLFRADNENNIVLRGYGATFQMQKRDYMDKNLYRKAEWRHTLSLKSCSDVTVLGLTFKFSGGDGIYIGNTGLQKNYCEDIYIKDVICKFNYRQGISVISAVNLLIEDSEMSYTSGTSPKSGIDFEPNRGTEKLVNCIVRNCLFNNNYGAGIKIYLGHNSPDSEDVSIKFENCYVTSWEGNGIVIGSIRDNGPNGAIEFSDCIIEDIAKNGLLIYDKSADRARVIFHNCTWRNVAKYELTPLLIQQTNLEYTHKLGGIDFIDCFIEDNKPRPFLTATGVKDSNSGVYDIKGNIMVKNRFGVEMKLINPHDVTLQVHEQESPLFVE